MNKFIRFYRYWQKKLKLISSNNYFSIFILSLFTLVLIFANYQIFSYYFLDTKQTQSESVVFNIPKEQSAKPSSFLDKVKDSINNLNFKISSWFNFGIRQPEQYDVTQPCSTNNDENTCESVPGCTWEINTYSCGLKSISECNNYSGCYISNQEEPCQNSECDAGTDGCNWQITTANCTNADCQASRAGCSWTTKSCIEGDCNHTGCSTDLETYDCNCRNEEYQVEVTRNCDIINCPSSCTYIPGSCHGTCGGTCSGSSYCVCNGTRTTMPSDVCSLAGCTWTSCSSNTNSTSCYSNSCSWSACFCSSKNESTCASSGCIWTADTCTGTYTTTETRTRYVCDTCVREVCTGGTYNDSCTGQYVTSSICTGSHIISRSCAGTYQSGTCTGIPTTPTPIPTPTPKKANGESCSSDSECDSTYCDPNDFVCADPNSIPVFCTPKLVECRASDNTQYRTCNLTGTGWSVWTACPSNQSCQNGKCADIKKSLTPTPTPTPNPTPTPIPIPEDCNVLPGENSCPSGTVLSNCHEYCDNPNVICCKDVPEDQQCSRGARRCVDINKDNIIDNYYQYCSVSGTYETSGIWSTPIKCTDSYECMEGYCVKSTPTPSPTPVPEFIQECIQGQTACNPNNDNQYKYCIYNPNTGVEGAWSGWNNCESGTICRNGECSYLDQCHLINDINDCFGNDCQWWSCLNDGKGGCTSSQLDSTQVCKCTIGLSQCYPFNNTNYRECYDIGNNQGLWSYWKECDSFSYCQNGECVSNTCNILIGDNKCPDGMVKSLDCSHECSNPNILCCIEPRLELTCSIGERECNKDSNDYRYCKVDNSYSTTGLWSKWISCSEGYTCQSGHCIEDISKENICLRDQRECSPDNKYRYCLVNSNNDNEGTWSNWLNCDSDTVCELGYCNIENNCRNIENESSCVSPCAWYVCSNGCYETGTPIGIACRECDSSFVEKEKGIKPGECEEKCVDGIIRLLS